MDIGGKPSEEWTDIELIHTWYNVEYVLDRCVSMRDIYYQGTIEAELVRRGYDLNSGGKIVKVQSDVGLQAGNGLMLYISSIFLIVVSIMLIASVIAPHIRWVP